MRSLSNNISPAPVESKEYKLFLVEVDDEDRERVLSARVKGCRITTQPEYADIHTDYSHLAVARYVTHEDVTMTLNMVTLEDGTYFRIENFTEEEEE